MSCMDAMVILSDLSPETSNDPETTGIAGAINKYIWMDTKDITFLNKAISFYNRGYTIKKDYYNGENLALCYFEKSKQLKNTETANDKDIVFNEILAEKTFKSVLEITEGIIESTNFNERSDVKWVYATAAKSASYLELKEKEDLYSSKFKSLCDNSWDFNTFEENKIKKD